MKKLLLGTAAVFALGFTAPAMAHCGTCGDEDNHGTEAVDAAHAEAKHVEDAATEAADEAVEAVEGAAEAVEGAADDAEEHVEEAAEEHADEKHDDEHGHDEEH
ncbi:MAG: hypothetical protein ACRBCT_04565 [Alphaproteobacteria bacterium]